MTIKLRFDCELALAIDRFERAHKCFWLAPSDTAFRSSPSEIDEARTYMIKVIWVMVSRTIRLLDVDNDYAVDKIANEIVGIIEIGGD